MVLSYEIKINDGSIENEDLENEDPLEKNVQKECFSLRLSY